MKNIKIIALRTKDYNALMSILTITDNEHIKVVVKKISSIFKGFQKNCNTVNENFLQENGYIPSVLRQVEVPIVLQSECQKAYAQFGNLTDNMICAGFIQTGGKDACQVSIDYTGKELQLSQVAVKILSIEYSKCQTRI